MDNNTSGELKSIGELLRKSWEIYRSRMWTLVGIGLTAVLLPALALAPMFFLGFFASQSGSGFQPLMMVGAVLLGMAGALWLGNWGISAFLTAIVDDQCGIKEAFVKAKPKILAHIWLGVLTAFIVMGGYFLLFVPGVIFAIWFFFAPFVFIEEDVRGMDALLKSKAYVSGKWIAVCIRLIAVWLLSALVSLIPFVGQLLALFLIPLCFVYTFLVYRDLKALKGEIPFHPTKKEKMQFVAVSAFGLVMPVVFVFAFMGSMFFMPFSILKAKVAGTSPFPTEMRQDMGKGTFSISPVKTAVNVHVDDDGTLKKMPSDHAVVTTLKDSRNVEGNRIAIAVQEGMDGLDSMHKGAGMSADPKIKDKDKPKRKMASNAQAASGLSGTESKKYRDLIQTCEKALRIEPTDSLSYHNRAVAYFRLGQYEEAINDFTEALKNNDKDATAYYNRAIAHGMLGDYTKAIEDGIKAIELNPDDASAYANRGVDYIAVGRFEEAVSDFSHAINMNAADASVYYARGVAYHKLGAEEQAMEDFKHAAKKGYEKAREYLKARGQS